ncbi:MAG: DUF1615 domain-containing protein [Panacagrimonas sp.]
MNTFHSRTGASLGGLCLALIAGCTTGPAVREPPVPSPTQARALIVQLLPSNVANRNGWAVDIYAAFATQEIPPTPENFCSVIAITEQETGVQVDPPVPGLAAIAWREIDGRAAAVGIPKSVVRTALRAASPGGKTYSERIDAAKTERDLSEIFEDLIGALPLGKTFLADRNPVRTGGPMQVSIAFSEQYADHPYPYPVDTSLRREVFTRRGGMFFGIAHLLGYPASYDKPLYRFADFNAGHYASRNAAFQNALSLASGIPLDLDGDLVRIGGEADSPGSTELAARTLAKRLKMRDPAIRDDLERGRSADFEGTKLYEKVFALADPIESHPVPRALVPTIRLKSPKITRRLTTEWFATRVDQRYQRCLLRNSPAQPASPAH